jgi:hypothetical protein
MVPQRKSCPVRALLVLGCLFAVSAARAEDRPLRQLIDAEVTAAWQAQQIKPAPRADDAAFLRRLHLDLHGTIPTYEEAKQFLADADASKRQKLIDRLLDDPRFAGQQANVWDLVLFGRNPPNGDATRKRDGFKKWLADKFAKNEPYDRWARDLLLAEQGGSELFYVQFRGQPEEAAVAVSRVFLGTQLQCARCHDHPFEAWTQRDFYGMAGFFVRLVVVEEGADGKRRYKVGEKSTGEVLFTGAARDQKPGQKGEPIRPKFLGGAALEEPPTPKDFKEPELKTPKDVKPPLFSRKEKLAAWVTSAENPYFPRAGANRVWAQFMGRGLVHPVDDLGEASKASHPQLLDAMTRGLVDHKFDLKWLIREVVSSEAYQLASTGAGKDALPEWFERGRVRPLTAEELLASIRTAAGFDVGAKPGEAKLPSSTEEFMVRYFGEPTNGQGEFQASLTEHLFLNNSGQLRQMIQRKKGNLADVLLTSTEPWEQRVDRLFLSVLSRPPRPAERERFVAHLTSDPKAAPLVEEAIWVLLNTAGFRFNH